MAKLVNTTIYIGSTLLTQFSDLTLQQGIFNHHAFRIVCPGDLFESDDPYAKTKTLIGEPCTIQIKNFDGTGVPLQFKGIVTEIASNKFGGHTGDLVISGFSPTIVMDNVPHCKTWEKKNIKAIVGDVSGIFAANEVKFTTKPKTSETLSYTVQYKETAWQFINRLAATHGEWLFYNGKEVVFGLFEPQTDQLVFGSTLNHFSIAMQLRPPTFATIGYDYINNKTYNSSPKDIPGAAGLNDLGKFAYNKSKEVFSTAPKTYTHQFLSNKTQLDDAVKTKAAAESSNMVRFNGNSTKFGVQLGNTVSVDRNYGNFTVIDVTHRADGQGNYENDFIAIPATILVPPVTGYMEPECETQTAVVTDNNDPKHLGRIRVRFHWMNNNEKSPWLRIASPHGGGDKGMFFIPEIGEEAIVGFEGGNPQKAFIIGTAYHGKAKTSFANAGNDVKALQTRSGNRVIMNDKDASIFTSDGAGGADTLMDGKGNYTNNVKQNKSTHVGTNNTINAGSTNVINVGGEKGQPPQSLLQMDAGGNIVLDGKANITIVSGSSSITLAANGDITIQGINVKVIGSTVTEVGKEGAAPGIKINDNIEYKATEITGSASGPMKINGADVEINKG
jgi:type VI secretion system secreted protein VgrG